MPLDLEPVDAAPKLDLEPVADAPRLDLEPVSATKPAASDSIARGYQSMRESVAPGSFLPALEPFVKIPNPFERDDKLGKAIAAIAGDTARATAESVAGKIIGAAESIESPGGLMLLATVPAAPLLGTGIAATIASPAIIQGAKEAEAGLEEGSIPKVAGGLTEAALGALPLLAAKPALKGALDSLKPHAPAAAEAAKMTADTMDKVVNGEPAPATTEQSVTPVPPNLQAEARADLASELGDMAAPPREVTFTDPTIAESTPRPGPGAASPGDIPEATQIRQLTEAMEGTRPVRQPFSERFANELAAIREQVTGKAESTLDTLKSFGQHAVNALKGEYAWTDFKDALGKFSGESNRNDFELLKFTKQIRKSVPDKLRREAIVNWLQADGNREVLAQRAASSHPNYQRGYELATQLTPDEITLADNIRSYLDSKLQEGIDAGLLKAGVENYVSQVWRRPNPITRKLVGEVFTGKLAPNPRFARQRIFQSYFEGEQAGYHPRVKDIGALVAIYDQSFSKAIASRRLIKQLHEGTASDGRPLVEVSGVNVPVEGEAGSIEALLIKPKIKPSDAGDYLPIDHPALRGWRWAGTDENTGASILYQGDLLVHPEVHGHLKNVLSTSAFRQNAFTRGFLEAQSILKQSKLALSGFHFTQEGAHAAAHRVNPLAPRPIDFTNADQAALVDHGLQVADFRAYQAFAEGLSGAGSIYERVPVVGKWLSRYNEYLFQEYIPRLKMTMAMDALERNRARYGNRLSDDQILELTANQSNAAFGELNYTMLGRNPTLQDLFRVAALAPDFLEARLRFAAQALTGTGREQLTALVLQGATLYVASRLINQALSGDPHWDPKDAFEVFYNKRRYGIRTVVEDAMHLATDPRTFAYNRLAPLGKTIVEGITGRDWRGVKRTSWEQLQDLASWLLPITLGKQPQHTRTDQVLQAGGVTVRSATAQARIYEKLSQFKRDNNLMTAEEKQGMTSPSEYGPLRSAMTAGDMAAARREYETLLHPTDGTKAKTPQQVREHFISGARRPFSGSPRLEKQFVRSLDQHGQELYLEAQRERRDMALKFIEAQQKWMKER